ncbi:phosphodiester glycosidase family protein [Candidatus Methylacidithermus pantelleriae]|nr:phosphodiester glycosidase family protein [Candidatus Methylacidithermus pantelleriae]
MGASFLAALPLPARALSCSSQPLPFGTAIHCVVELSQDRLELFWKNPAGQPFGSFHSLFHYLEAQGKKVLFATNGGMYEPDLSPVGWYVEGGKELVKLNQRKGFGNFYLKPNGVLAWNRWQAWIGPSEEMEAKQADFLWATQSGPLLVHHGEITPAIPMHSRSRYIRNGVGLLDRHRVVFVITETPVTLYEFALIFRKNFSCREALYLDGSISSIYSLPLGIWKERGPMGPILAVWTPANTQSR